MNVESNRTAWLFAQVRWNDGFGGDSSLRLHYLDFFYEEAQKRASAMNRHGVARLQWRANYPIFGTDTRFRPFEIEFDRLIALASASLLSTHGQNLCL